MLCIKNTHFKYSLTFLLFLTLLTIYVLHYFGLYNIKPNQNKFLFINKNDTNIRQKHEINQTKKNPSKFIVYECRAWCGGFADRLKGIFSQLNLFTSE
jgi:predicted RND superfamily exporter protein